MKISQVSAIAATMLLLAAAPIRAQILGDYRDDFQGRTPATGWSYQYNSGGSIGTAANYTDLIHATTLYTSDVTGTFLSFNYVSFGASGGHPGPDAPRGQARPMEGRAASIDLRLPTTRSSQATPGGWRFPTAC